MGGGMVGLAKNRKMAIIELSGHKPSRDGYPPEPMTASAVGFRRFCFDPAQC